MINQFHNKHLNINVIKSNATHPTEQNLAASKQYKQLKQDRKPRKMLFER